MPHDRGSGKDLNGNNNIPPAFQVVVLERERGNKAAYRREKVRSVGGAYYPRARIEIPVVASDALVLAQPIVTDVFNKFVAVLYIIDGREGNVAAVKQPCSHTYKCSVDKNTLPVKTAKALIEITLGGIRPPQRLIAGANLHTVYVISLLGKRCHMYGFHLYVQPWQLG